TRRDMPTWTSPFRIRSVVGRLTRLPSFHNESRLHLDLQLRLPPPPHLHLHRRLRLNLQLPLHLEAKKKSSTALPTGKRLQQQMLERIEANLRPGLHRFAAREQFFP